LEFNEVNLLKLIEKPRVRILTLVAINNDKHCRRKSKVSDVKLDFVEKRRSLK